MLGWLAGTAALWWASSLKKPAQPAPPVAPTAAPEPMPRAELQPAGGAGVQLSKPPPVAARVEVTASGGAPIGVVGPRGPSPISQLPPAPAPERRWPWWRGRDER